MKKAIGAILILSSAQLALAGDERNYLGECVPHEPSVTQSFVIDNRTGESFGQTLKKISPDSNVTGAIISRYPGVGGVLTAKSWTDPQEIIGHQGLSIQYIGGQRYFWGALNEQQAEDAGTYAIRYKLREQAVESVELFKFFPDKKTLQPTTPAISSDEKFLTVQMVRKSNYEIRSFDLRLLNQSGDYSNAYSYRFIIKRDHPVNGPHALQALASDGSRIFMLMGSFKVGENNALNIYSMNGDFMDSIDMNIGVERAQKTGKGVNYEPEGLTWLKTSAGKELILQVAAGEGKDRSCTLYRTGIYTK